MKIEKNVVENSKKTGKLSIKSFPVLDPNIIWYFLFIPSVLILILIIVNVFLVNRKLELEFEDPIKVVAGEILYKDLDLAEILPYAVIPEDLDFSKISAEVIYAYNPVTHQTFFEKNITEKKAVASITKLLTVLVSSEVFELDSELIAGSYDINELYWMLELEPGDKMTYEDAVKAMLISSYNDVPVMVAENYPGGYDMFIEAMNSKARSIGMLDSNFVNPSGLDQEGGYSTARDLKRLVQEVLKNELIMSVVGKYSDQVTIYKANGQNKTERLISTNQLLGTNVYLKGLKTGSTENAGQCFIGYWSAEEHDQLIIIVLNSENNRFDETQEIFNQLRSVEYIY